MSRRIRTAPARVAVSTVTEVAQSRSPDPVTFTETDEQDGQGNSAGVIAENLTLGGAGQSTPRSGMLSRTVTYATSTTQAEAPDSYIDRLVKYIPSEIVALYLGVINVVPHQDTLYWQSLWTIAIVTMLITPVYMYFVTDVEGEPPAWTQIAVSSVAFPIWVFATGGPFAQYAWYAERHWIAAVILTFSTFLIGIHKPDTGGAANPASAPSPAPAPAD